MLSHTSCSYFYSEFEYVFTWSGIPLNFFKYVPSKNFHITGKYLITKKRKRLQRQDWRDLSHFSRSSRPEVFLRKVVLKICSKFTGDPWRSNFIEITLWHGCFPVNLPHIFRTSFPRNTSGWLLLRPVFSCTSTIPTYLE